MSAKTNIGSRQDPIAEVARLMAGMSQNGLAIVLDKARDVAKEYPHVNASVIQFPKQRRAP